MTRALLVIGGNGQTGQQIVAKLRAHGDTVRVLSRRPDAVADAQIVRGDITDSAAVRAAMADVAGVVIIVESADNDDAPNSPERVHYGGALHVIAAASPHTQIVLVTQIYITRPERYPQVRNIIHWHGQAEAAVRASGNPYTIVRPSWLLDDPGTYTGLRLELGDMGEGRISRTAVAEACAQALWHAEAQGKTFELYGQNSAPPSDWSALFATLAPDRLEAMND